MAISLSLSWATLRDIQHNKVVKSTYVWLFIVPITAKIFSKIDSELSFVFNNQTITFDLTLPFSWQALFFSAVFFVLANLSVSIFIPDLIKTYKDFSEFSDSGKTKTNLDEIKKVWGISLQKKSIAYEKYPRTKIAIPQMNLKISLTKHTGAVQFKSGLIQ